MSDNIIVLKIGTSSLVHKNGGFNISLMDAFLKVCCDLSNSGKKVVIVSSGAIGVGMSKCNLELRPKENAKRQALAAIGQLELMHMYDKIVTEWGNKAAQILLTADDINNEKSAHNIKNTFTELFNYGAIPIVNENDTVSIGELEGERIGDNDTLSAIIASLLSAKKLIMLTDIDALYDRNPKEAGAKRIEEVFEITEEIEHVASNTETEFGTGGMVTKIKAAKIATKAGVDTHIIKSDNPKLIYDILDSKKVGTVFYANK